MKKLDNIFLAIGLTAFALMVMQLDFVEVWTGVQRAGYWFPLVIVLWALLYVLNTTAWGIIIQNTGTPDSRESECHNVRVSETVDAKVSEIPSCRKSESSKSTVREFSWLWLYKITVSGFALNYATPGGLMGGEAYRIAQLTSKIGVERASSSVILYVMTHIFSHFWFWLISALLYIACYRVTLPIGILLSLTIAFCLAAIWFFLRGYKKGVANMLVKLFAKLPFLHKKMGDFIAHHKDKLDNIDHQTAALHSQNPCTFFMAVFLELLCRVLSSFEIMFVLLIITPEISFLQSMLILAFTSLFANMLFFLPLQLGGREGGFMMSVSGLSISASAGVFVALIVRLRELFWTALGLLLIKIRER